MIAKGYGRDVSYTDSLFSRRMMIPKGYRRKDKDSSHSRRMMIPKGYRRKDKDSSHSRRRTITKGYRRKDKDFSHSRRLGVSASDSLFNFSFINARAKFVLDMVKQFLIMHTQPKGKGTKATTEKTTKETKDSTRSKSRIFDYSFRLCMSGFNEEFTKLLEDAKIIAGKHQISDISLYDAVHNELTKRTNYMLITHVTPLFAQFKKHLSTESRAEDLQLLQGFVGELLQYTGYMNSTVLTNLVAQVTACTIEYSNAASNVRRRSGQFRGNFNTRIDKSILGPFVDRITFHIRNSYTKKLGGEGNNRGTYPF